MNSDLLATLASGNHSMMMLTELLSSEYWRGLRACCKMRRFELTWVLNYSYSYSYSAE